MSADVPQAWPALLTIEQLRVYLGGMSEPTLRKICPVPPIALGAQLVRYNRTHIDAWIATLPPRLLHVVASGQDAPAAPPAPDIPVSRSIDAVERARLRATRKKPAPCRKTA